MKSLTVFLCLFLSSMALSQDIDELLEMSLDELLNVNVTTASKSVSRISDSPAIISVVTFEEIRNLGARTLADLLNLTPGFEVNRAVMFGVHETVGVRGRMTDFGEDVLILIDGQRLNEGYTGGGTHQAKFINLDNVERVELIRGPGSTLYGSNAFVGIVNVITQKLAAENKKGSIQLRAGQDGQQHLAFSYGKEGSDFSWLLSGNYQSDDGQTYQPGKGFLRPPIPLPEIQDPIEKAYDLNFRLRAGNLQIDMDHFTRKLDGFMPWGFLDQAWDSEILDTNQDDSRLTRIQAQYDWNVKSNLIITPSIRAFEGQLRQLYFLAAPGVAPFSPGTSLEELGWIGSPNHDTRTTEYEIQFNYTAKKHDIVGGILYANEELTGAWNRFNFFPFPTDLPIIDYGSEIHWFDGAESYADPLVRDISAMYVQDTWKPNDKVGVTFGLRHDDYSDFGSSTNPRLGIIYKPSSKLHFKALYGQAFRAPTFNELYIRNNPVQRGNENLQAQTITTTELFASYSVSKNMVVSMSAYYNQYEDLINLINQSPLPTFENATQTEKDTGLELEVKYKKGRNRYIFASYSWIDPENVSGEQRAYIATQKFSLVANFDIKNKVILNLNGFYRGDRANPTPDPDHDISNTWITNFNIRIPNLFKGGELRLNTHDLFDEGIKSPGFSYVLTPENVPNRGRHISLDMKWTF